MNKKMICLAALVSCFSFVMIGCGKDAAAESTPSEVGSNETTISEEARPTDSDSVKLNHIDTEISSPEPTPQAEPEASEEPIIDSPDDTSGYADFDYDDPSSVDYRAFCTGDLFEIDDYMVALGYNIALDQNNPEQMDSCYYNIEKNGIKFSVYNYDFMMRVTYQDYDAGIIYVAGLDRFGFGDTNMVVQSLNHRSRDVSERWVEEIAKAMKYIATSNSFDIDSIPFSKYYVVKDEGMGVYDGNGTFYIPESDYTERLEQYDITN